MAYELQTVSFRAQCVNVVDGDTVDLYVDQGFHGYGRRRFRIYGIDCPELNDRDPGKRAVAQSAKARVESLLNPNPVVGTTWGCRIETFKDPDSFGRWLAKVYFSFGGHEYSVGDVLLLEGLAVPYVR